MAILRMRNEYPPCTDYTSAHGDGWKMNGTREKKTLPPGAGFQLLRKSTTAWRVGRAPTADMWSRPGTIAAEPWGNMAARGPEEPAMKSWSPSTTRIGFRNDCKTPIGKGPVMARMQAAR